MKTRIFTRWRRDVARGVTLEANGIARPLPVAKRYCYKLSIPIQWEGTQAEMYFDSRRYGEYNPLATRLLDHPHLSLHGAVYIVTHYEERFLMRVWASQEEVMDALQHVNLSAEPIIINVGKRVAQQDIYVATRDDLFWVKMAL